MSEPDTKASPSVVPQGFIAGLWLAGLFFWTLAPLAGYDFWYYLAVGRDVVQTGKIPWEESYLGTTSPYGFGSYANAGWLGNLICYVCYLALGYLGLVLLKSTLLCGITAAVYRANRLLGLSPFWAGAWASLGLWTIRGRFEMRTYLMTDLALALLILVVIQAERQARTRTCATQTLLLFAVWANLHQGVLAGFLVMGSWLILGRAPVRRRLLLTFCAIGGALLQPHALTYPRFLFDHFSNSSAIQGVVEWAPPSLEGAVTHLGLFLAVVAVATAKGLLDVVKGRKPHASWFGLITALVFALQATRSIRSISELLSITCPLMAGWFPRLASGARLQGLVALSLAGLFLGTFRPVRWAELSQVRGYPEALLESLPANHGQVFNSFEFGNFLVFRGVPPFLHGMTMLYKEQLIHDFESVLHQSPDSQEILERYRVDVALLHFPQGEDATRTLLDGLAQSPDWQLCAWDDTGLLFLKNSPSLGLTAVKPWRVPAWTDNAAAEAELSKLVETYPSGFAYRLLSQLLLERGDLAQATEMALRAVRLSPEFVPAWTQLGLCYSKAGNLEGLLLSSAGALRAAPEEASVRFNRGLALWERSKHSQGAAAAWYRYQAAYQNQRALWIDPHFAPALRLRDLL